MGLRRSPAREGPHFLRRAQPEQVRRSRRKRLLRRRLLLLGALFALGVACGAAYAGRYYLTHASRFALRGITITGVRLATREPIRSALERHRGRNLFRLDLARLEEEVTGVRWVKRAVLKRVLPDRLLCSIEEREPRGLALVGDRVWLVDAAGVPIDRYGTTTRGYSFPIFTGIAAKDQDGARARIRRGMALLEYLEAAHPELAVEISEIDLGREDRVTLRLNEGGPVVRLHPQEFGKNLERYLAMREYLATHFGDGAYVDLRFRDRIAFRPLLTRGR